MTLYSPVVSPWKASKPGVKGSVAGTIHGFSKEIVADTIVAKSGYAQASRHNTKKVLTGLGEKAILVLDLNLFVKCLSKYEF